MLTLRKVAVTGGLASGKTTVCRLLASLGAYVVSADEIVHQLLSPNTETGKQVVSLLGSEIISNQSLDRTKIAEKVFSHPKKLQLLEQILHPAVLHEIEKQFLEVKKRGNISLFVAEIPLLYESESEQYFDAVIALLADRSVCKKRFSDARSISELEFDKRMERQWKPEQKATKADYVIINNGSLEELKQQVLTIYKDLINKNNNL